MKQTSRFWDVCKALAQLALITGAAMGLIYGAKAVYTHTNSIWWYFIYMNLQDSVALPLCIGAWFFVTSYQSPKKKIVSIDENGVLREMLYRESRDYRTMKKIYLGAVIAAVVYLAIFNLFPVSGRFNMCLIDNQTPTRYQYKAAIIMDALDGATQTADIPADQIIANVMGYTYRIGQYRTGGGYGRGYAETVHYVTGDDRHSVWMANSTARRYIYQMTEIEDSIRIAYYERTGFIQSLDEISPYDDDGLQMYLSERQVLARERQERLRKEQMAEEAARREQEKEEERRWSFTYETMIDSEGRQISEIQQEFRKNNVPFEIHLEYTSTQQFEVGEVAFFDLPGRTAYVVRDQNAEEMIEVPYIDHDMTLREIRKVLDKAGIQYSVLSLDEDQWEENAEKHLYLYYCPPGTWIPQDFIYTFSVEN